MPHTPRKVHFVNMFFTSPYGACGKYRGNAVYEGRNFRGRSGTMENVTCPECKKAVARAEAAEGK